MVFLYPFLRKRGTKTKELFIGQPMGGETDEGALAERERAIEAAKELLGENLWELYYELTHNGGKNELYFDAYIKFRNMCLKL